MKKNNQKGFVLAEAFIVSTFVLGILVFMFLQIKTIINGYNKSFTYNTIPGIYNSREIKKFLKKNDYDSLLAEAGSNDYVILDSTNTKYTDIFEVSNVKTVVISKGDLSVLKESKKLSPKFQDYIKTLANSGGYQFIVEYNDDTFANIKG